MAHPIHVGHPAATVELGCGHHFLITAVHPYFFQLLSYHMVDDEAASVTLAFPELAGIIVAVIQKDNAQTMGQAVGLVDFALVGSAIGQERPFFGI